MRRKMVFAAWTDTHDRSREKHGVAMEKEVCPGNRNPSAD